MMKHTVLPAVLALGVSTPLFAAPNEQPAVVPALHEWVGSEGTLKANLSQIVAGPSQPDELKQVVRLFAAELGGNAKVTEGKKDKPGGIHFQLVEGDADSEAYKIVIGDQVIVTASSPAGIYYATRTLHQLLRQGDLPKGTIEDAPKYPVRSVLVDVGRKFMPVDQLKDWIRIMGWMKINELHLHLNDNSWGRYPGYRLESKAFPGLASEDGHYTFEQIRELQDFAKLHGVVIVPEIDSPGHSLAFTTLRPDLAQKEMDRDGFGLAYLDLANPEAIRFMEQIWDEVCPLFDSELVHIGTDEYRVNLIKDEAEREEMGERFRAYINHLNSYITKKHGKVVRTWSGYEHMAGTTEPDTAIIIDMWETSDAKNKVAAGYQVVNSSHFYTYIVPGAPYYGVSNPFIYNTWTPMQFSGEPEGMLDESDPGLMGAKLHVWNDYGPTGYTWNEITRLTVPSMAAMSEKLWGKDGAGNYQEFVSYASDLTSNIPQVELTTRDAAVESGTVWKMDGPMETIANTTVDLDLPSENLEWPWTASVTLTRHNDIRGDEVLLSSDLATLYVDLSHTAHDKKQKKDITKRGVALVRANQAPGHDPITSYNPDVLVFDYQLPVGEDVRLTFVGEERQTSLYVDGKFVQSIGKQTVCPLTRIGDTLPRTPHATVKSLEILSTAPQQLELGNWNPQSVSETATAVEFELTEPLRSSANYQVEFQYTGGAHRLDIKKVELLEDGKVIHTDKTAGFTGGKSENNIYALPALTIKEGAKYTVRATIHSEGGSDSNGTITLRDLP